MVLPIRLSSNSQHLHLNIHIPPCVHGSLPQILRLTASQFQNVYLLYFEARFGDETLPALQKNIPLQ
jgi:hypothetical protein